MSQQMKRVLIVEDSPIIAEHIATIIHGGGFIPIGPALTIEEALDTLDFSVGSIDAALLDLCLDGTTETLAHRLDRMGIPYAFATGNRAFIPAGLSQRPVCEKPFTAANLLATLESVFDPGPTSEACRTLN
jgi:CheY-like chemotaxis protein